MTILKFMGLLNPPPVRRDVGAQTDYDHMDDDHSD